MSAGRPVGDQPDVPLDAVAHGTEIGHIQSLHTARRHRVTVATSPEARPRSATTVTLPRHLWWSGLRRFDSPTLWTAGGCTSWCSAKGPPPTCAPT
ncbi:hypothetical protein BH23ACT7_BH23ACT7_04450 [soil metagenome]